MPADERPRRPARWLLWGPVALAVVLVTAGDLYVVGTTRTAMEKDFSRVPARPYAMVLGNQIVHGAPSRELAARLETGRQLYRAGLARRIIVSGLVRDSGYDEPDAMATWLRARGVPDADLVIDRGGYRTAASMADAAAMGVQELLVVSQAYHLPRAIYLARHAGMSAVGVPCADVPGRRLHPINMFFREALARTETLVEIALRGVRGLSPDQIPSAPRG